MTTWTAAIILDRTPLYGFHSPRGHVGLGHPSLRTGTSPALKATIWRLSADVLASSGQIQTANTALTRSLAVQDSALRQASAKAAPRARWLYLGRITQDRSGWAPDAG